jgi:bis(5'-nucleosyl)-tetraphosphatase (symmetrical)
LARYAIGDIQGCYAQLRALVERLRFSPDRDQLWFVGDLVNRGPQSLEVLRYVRALGDNAVVVLGNHDLHLLALAHGNHKRRSGDTLDAIFDAPDRDAIFAWLLSAAAGAFRCAPRRSDGARGSSPAMDRGNDGRAGRRRQCRPRA